MIVGAHLAPQFPIRFFSSSPKGAWGSETNSLDKKSGWFDGSEWRKKNKNYLPVILHLDLLQIFLETSKKILSQMVVRLWFTMVESTKYHQLNKSKYIATLVFQSSLMWGLTKERNFQLVILDYQDVCIPIPLLLVGDYCEFVAGVFATVLKHRRKSNWITSPRMGVNMSKLAGS